MQTYEILLYLLLALSITALLCVHFYWQGWWKGWNDHKDITEASWHRQRTSVIHTYNRNSHYPENTYKEATNGYSPDGEGEEG